MLINADFKKRVPVHAGSLPWRASPVPGVERRMLDRIGDEAARATTIVRFAPGSAFSAHTHGGGEEFLVLEGVFQDEEGDHPAGFYIRNPPGSAHRPCSEPGCVIFVKLWQFDAADRQHVRVDTSALAFQPALGQPGISSALLYRDAHEEVSLEKWAPDAAAAYDCPGGCEILVLDGSFEEGGEEFRYQSWLRLPAGYKLRATSGPRGCKVWIKRGGHRPPS